MRVSRREVLKTMEDNGNSPFVIVANLDREVFHPETYEALKND